MADLKTKYMGIDMNSPIVVGACTLSGRVDNIIKAEEAGAGALVIYSLFQEEIELEAQELHDELMIGAERFPESITYFPQMESSGPREHIMWTEKARKEVKMPLIGSLNATSVGKWVEYAKLFEDAGCDGLELNMYAIETNPDKSPYDVEKQQLEIINSVKTSVSIPVSVKLSPWYTSVANFAKKASEAGADGLVLFNRFYQPTIDPDKEQLKQKLDLSSQEEMKMPLRWTAILSGVLEIDIAASTGVQSGNDVARYILAGARATQTVSSLYRNGIDHITRLNRELSEWMDAKGYSTIEEFRGKLNQKNVSDPYAFERAQYMKLLITKQEKYAKYGSEFGYPSEVK